MTRIEYSDAVWFGVVVPYICCVFAIVFCLLLHHDNVVISTDPIMTLGLQLVLQLFEGCN